jgi:hypothetical protein
MRAALRRDRARREVERQGGSKGRAARTGGELRDQPPTLSGTGTTAHGSWFKIGAGETDPPAFVIKLKPRFGGAFLH